MAAPAAGALPCASKLTNNNARGREKKSRGRLRMPQSVPPQASARLGRAWRRRAVDARRVRGARRRGDHAGADRGRPEGRQGRLVHLGRPAARREGRQGIRDEVSRHRGARGALRRRARVPAHRAGIFEPHPCGRRGQLLRRRAPHRVEARRLARALRPGGRRQALCGRAQGRGRHVRELPRDAQRDRLQHQTGESRRTRRRASPTCSIRNGPARS